MDLFSGLFGDVDDDSMYVKSTVSYNGSRPHRDRIRSIERLRQEVAGEDGEQDGGHRDEVPSHLEQRPRDICDLDAEKRKAGVEVAKKWLDGAAMLGAKSMRVNSGGPRIAPTPVADPSSYPKNDELAQYLTNCIESFKEMADHGGKVGRQSHAGKSLGTDGQSDQHPDHHRRSE